MLNPFHPKKPVLNLGKSIQNDKKSNLVCKNNKKIE